MSSKKLKKLRKLLYDLVTSVNSMPGLGIELVNGYYIFATGQPNQCSKMTLRLYTYREMKYAIYLMSDMLFYFKSHNPFPIMTYDQLHITRKALTIYKSTEEEELVAKQAINRIDEVIEIMSSTSWR